MVDKSNLESYISKIEKEEPDDRIYQISFSPDGKLLATAAYYGIIRLYETIELIIVYIFVCYK